ncbi:MAG: hypothetical protein JO247_03980 [Chloroflexi bacterium]|nr:hypothetical protein [Chloroflexota bacterium]
MIGTDTYPNLDGAHREALFEAVHEVVRESLEDPGQLVASLPPAFAERYDGEFNRRFAATLATVTWKLTEPEHVFPLACRAEELALNYVIATAERLYRAAHPNGVPDYDEVRERLFEDDEYLQLWDEHQAADLRFEEWFEPFRPTEQVHPYCQKDAEAFDGLWSNQEPLEEDLFDPEAEVYLVLGEDWLDVPNQVADQIPAILQETMVTLFPEAPGWRRLSERDRDRLFDSVAEDVRLLLEAARREDRAYDVWAVPAGETADSRLKLHAGVALNEALDLRRLERAGDYRGMTDVTLCVYPADHHFDSAS